MHVDIIVLLILSALTSRPIGIQGQVKSLRWLDSFGLPDSYSRMLLCVGIGVIMGPMTVIAAIPMSPFDHDRRDSDELQATVSALLLSMLLAFFMLAALGYWLLSLAVYFCQSSHDFLLRLLGLSEELPEYPEPMGPTSHPRNSEDYRSPILAGKDHKFVGSGTNAVVFRSPSATRDRFKATKVISLVAVPYDVVIDAYVEEVRILQILSAKKAEAREKREVDPGMERVMALDDPDDHMELFSDGRLCITTVSQISARLLFQPLILEVGLLPRISE